MNREDKRSLAVNLFSDMKKNKKTDLLNEENILDSDI